MAQMTRTPASNAPALGGMFDRAAHYAPVVGRVLLAVLFVTSGVMKFPGWETTAKVMAEKGIPLIPVSLPAAAILEIAGGLSLLLGLRARLGALALFLFLIPATVIFHDFWNFSDYERASQMQHFLKNVAIMGGLLMIVCLGSGPLSIDGDRRPEAR